MDDDWDKRFLGEGLEPLRLSYDELSAAPQGVLTRVLDALGINPAIARTVEALTAKLANAISRDWMERFEAEHSP